MEGTVVMYFSDLDIKEEYRSKRDNVVLDFYIPLLRCAVKYQRSVGFFSSSSLAEIAPGLSYLVKNGGRVEMVASPKLSKDDVLAIKSGLKKRDEVIQENLLAELQNPENATEAYRLSLLANLVASRILEIKIAVISDNDNLGMYHEKLGIMYDELGNIVAFSGSMNESSTAFMHNYESIDVFRSWSSNFEEERAINKCIAFRAIWNGEEPNMQVFDFPVAVRNKILKYRQNDSFVYNKINNGTTYLKERVSMYTIEEGKELEPSIPEWFLIRDYQQEAIDTWRDRNYVGIFDMATGTGKTYTGLAAVVDLYKHRKVPLAVFIICPYQHLVTQWVDDIRLFGMKPIICHSDSPQRNWKSRLDDACLRLELGIEKYFCAIFTNDTYASDYVQKTIAKVKVQALLLADEAHNLGAEKTSSCLDDRIPYRLALSATLERFGDENGTKRLYQFFGKKCITYSLKQAIDNKMLVPYYYHPIVVSFNEQELEQYIEISRKIASALHLKKKNESISEYAKRLLLKRARMVASTEAKLERLISEISTFSHESHMLVYCGATTVEDIDYQEGHASIEEKKQIDVVVKHIGQDLGMSVAKFTAEESADEREVIKREFDEGNAIQVLVAIRCLDEGVNIPSIQKAFILASSTNPKEYIQRRGRVLRKHKDKKFADIYDFIVSPLSLDVVRQYDEEIIRLSQSLVKKEIMRMRDFAELSQNPSEADEYIYIMSGEYGIELEEDESDEEL